MDWVAHLFRACTESSVLQTHGCVRTAGTSEWSQAPLPRDQILLVPQALGDRIPPDHTVRLLWEILDGPTHGLRSSRLWSGSAAGVVLKLCPASV